MLPELVEGRAAQFRRRPLWVKAQQGTYQLSPQLPSSLGYSQSMPPHRASAPISLRHLQSLCLGTRLLSPERQLQVGSHPAWIASLLSTHTSLSLYGRKEPGPASSPKLTGLAEGNNLPAGSYGEGCFPGCGPTEVPGVKPDSANPIHGLKP